MFVAVLFAAFGTAAIRFASPFWAGLTMAVTVPLLFAAILGALFRLGQARAFWTGMAVCGWGYLLIVLVPWFDAGVGQHLPTSCFLNYAEEQLQPEAPGIGPDGGPMGPGGMTSSGGLVGSISVGPDHSLVLRTGHALFALLFGFFGGVTAKWFYLTRAPREDEVGHG